MKYFKIDRIDVECEDASHIKVRFRFGLLCLDLNVVLPGIGRLKRCAGVSEYQNSNVHTPGTQMQIGSLGYRLSGSANDISFVNNLMLLT
jgi:hypothetical protein